MGMRGTKKKWFANKKKPALTPGIHQENRQANQQADAAITRPADPPGNQPAHLLTGKPANRLPKRQANDQPTHLTGPTGLIAVAINNVVILFSAIAINMTSRTTNSRTARLSRLASFGPNTQIASSFTAAIQ